MSQDISKLSKEARIEFEQIYNKYPNAVKGLCDFPGEVGRLAHLCIACGNNQSH